MKYFIALSPSLACKSGSVGSDGSVVSTTASSVYQTHAYTEAIWVQTTFFEPLGHSPPYCNPLPSLMAARSHPTRSRSASFDHENSMPVVAAIPERFSITGKPRVGGEKLIMTWPGFPISMGDRGFAERSTELIKCQRPSPESVVMWVEYDVNVLQRC